MTIAVQIDGRMLTSLRRQGSRLVGRKSPAAYIAIPPGDAEKRLLERARIPYATCDGATIVFARYADELAPLLHVPRLPVLPQGRLPEDDPVGRQLAAAIFESLLPPPQWHDDVCAIVLPPGVGAPIEASREWEFFSRLSRLKGYRPIAVDACEAVALAELGHAGFTGLVLVLGSASSGLAVAHRGRLLAHASIPCGGDWIDEHLARKLECIVWDMDGTSYVDLDAIGRWKRATAPQLNAPQNDEVQLLVYIYEQLLGDVMKAFAAACREVRVLEHLHQPLGLVCCGRPAMLTGFSHVLAERLRRMELPLEISELRISEDADYTLARGGLIRAELEAESLIGARSA